MTDVEAAEEARRVAQAQFVERTAIVEFDGITGLFAESLGPLLAPVGELRTMPGNPRRGDVQAVMRSYRKFGQRKPIVTRADGTVTDGNHQLLAARQMGWTHIARVMVDEDETTSLAYGLAANRTGELGSYDSDELLAMINSVKVDADLIAASAWSAKEIAKLEAKVNPPALDTDPQLGDVEYRIIVNCADEAQQTVLLERFREEGIACKGQMI